MDTAVPPPTASVLTIPPHEGVVVRLGDGKDYTIPPLTLGQVKRCRPILNDLLRVNVLTDEDGVDKVVAVAHPSLVRNYPEVTPETVENLIDLRNMKAVVAAILGLNGYLEPAKGTGTGP